MRRIVNQHFGSALLMPLLLALSCRSLPEVKQRFSWGMNPDQVKSDLHAEPETLKQRKSNLIEHRYDDNYLPAKCYITFQFLNEKLFTYYYVCSGEDLENRLRSFFSAKYGDPETVKEKPRILKFASRSETVILHFETIREKFLAKVTVTSVKI